MKLFTIILTISLNASICFAYDFSYSISDPSASTADEYIVSKSNVKIIDDGTFVYWKQDVGTALLEESEPGTIIYKFDFQKPIAQGNFFTRITTFHWSYSKGHSFIYASKDGIDWIKLAEATPPPDNGGYNIQYYNDALPSEFIGVQQVWIKIELNSYGTNASYGGAMTNTAQHLRYEKSKDNTTFRLEVDFDPEPIPPSPCQASVTILTNSNPNHTITSGCDEQVYGTSSFNQITLESGANAELLNFPGSNAITIEADSSLFTVSRSGAMVTFTGSDGTVLKIPATGSVQTISFNGEEIRVLQIYNNQVVLDDQVIGTTPIDLGSIDDEENTITLDPQSIGGVGSQILYGGVWHSTPIAVAEGYLVGIQVGNEYYLYHPELGENVTFSEETNKRAVGYALFGRTSSDVQSNTAETPQRIVLSQSYLGEDRKKTELSTGVELEVIGSEIKLTNKYIRWVAINVHKNITAYSYETTTHYLSPASLATDSIDIAKALMPALALSGNTITISSENVFQIEVHGAVVRGTPVFSLTTWPDGLTEAKNADNDLVTNLNTLDLLHFGFRAFKNTVQLVPYECFDFVSNLFADLIELILLSQYPSNERLTMANSAGLTASVVNNLVNCFTSTASLGALELVHTTWDIIKATDWVLEDIVSGNYEIMHLDAYNTIDIITIDNFSIDPLDSFPDVSYIEGDPLNLSHFNFALIYSSYNDSINAQDKYFGYGMPEYTRRGVSSSKPTGYTLTTSDTSVKFTLPQSDLEIVKRTVTDQSVILAHSLSDLSATQNITVDDEKEVSWNPRYCPQFNPIDYFYSPILLSGVDSEGNAYDKIACNYFSGINGQLQHETPFTREGESPYIFEEKNGIAWTWYEGGEFKGSTPYKAGRLHGIKKEYHPIGNLIKETPYLEGRLHGVVKEYYAYPSIYLNGNEKIAVETTYSYGEKDGETRYYDSKGVMTSCKIYESGTYSSIGSCMP